MKSRPKLTMVRCSACGFPTTWHYAWRNDGRCRPCVEGVAAVRAADERRARILARTREES